MDAFTAGVSELLQELITDFQKNLAGLPQEALDWSPGPELNSLAVLTAHTVGATRFWLSDVVLGESSGRVREAEFLTTGVTEAELHQRLEAIMDYAKQLLSGLSSSDLQRDCFHPRQNRTYSVASALLHAAGHLAEHAGHVQMTRQLWEQRADSSQSLPW